MAKSKHLEKRAKEVILERMRDSGEMSVEEIMDLVRPHYFFDAQEAREQGIRRQANRLVRSLRDEAGVRTCFAVKKDNLYVNLERCTDLNHVTAVEGSLRKQMDGLALTHKKAERRQQELAGQIKFST